MKNARERGACLLLTLVLLLGLSVPAAAVSEDALSAALTDTAQYVYQTVKSPQVGSIGGEWAVLGLARSGFAVPEEYYQSYYAAVEDYVKDCGGVLHEKKYTEYSRVILALSAIGRDARNVAGYDLTKALGDFDKTVWQGVNGPAWALIALDSRDYPMPVNPEAKTQATRQMYVDEILSRQLNDGGWNLTDKGGDGRSDPDVTGMVLQALARYQDQPAVASAVSAALECMSGLRDADGGFASYGEKNVESVVQMVVALCELGLSPDDARFVKNGNTMLDYLMTCRQPGNGFRHTADGQESSQMATEQGLYCLAAVLRAVQGENSLYRMDDAVPASAGEGKQSGAGLAGKHADVKAQPVIRPGAAFPDISDAHADQEAIEALASRGIISGKDGGVFDPDAAMTRAEFASIVVRALGLPLAPTDRFTDVKPADWYAPYVGAAYTYGIVSGTTATTFAPNGTITRQEAAVMVARAAVLCGMDTELDAGTVRDTLAPFTDYITVGEWARSGMAFCYQSGILDSSALDIQPKAPVMRCEIARMLFRLLDSADLL